MTLQELLETCLNSSVVHLVVHGPAANLREAVCHGP